MRESIRALSARLVSDALMSLKRPMKNTLTRRRCAAHELSRYIRTYVYVGERSKRSGEIAETSDTSAGWSFRLGFPSGSPDSRLLRRRRTSVGETCTNIGNPNRSFGARKKSAIRRPLFIRRPAVSPRAPELKLRRIVRLGKR